MDSGFPSRPFDSFAGMKVIINPLLDQAPKLQLSPEFNACSPEFKAKFNAWLAERFGYKDPMIYMVAGTPAMGPRTYQVVRAQLAREAHNVKS